MIDLFHAELARAIDDLHQQMLVWRDERTLAAGVGEVLRLSALPVVPRRNASATSFVKVKAVLLMNTANVADGVLSIGGAASNPWQGPFVDGAKLTVVRPNSWLLLLNKQSYWNVVHGVADTLRIANCGAGSIRYKIAILGAFA